MSERKKDILKRLTDPDHSRKRTQEDRDRVARKLKESRNKMRGMSNKEKYEYLMEKDRKKGRI